MKTLKFAQLTTVKPITPVIVAILSVTVPTPSVEVNTPITMTATLHDPVTGEAAPITDTFQVPILDPSGNVKIIKGVSFTNGVATTTLTFTKSGYYCLTEAAVNSELPADSQISLPAPLQITVFE